MRRLLLIPIAGAAALGLTACSSASSGSDSSAITANPGGAGATTSPGAGAPSGAQAPAVANATNLQVEPVISAGTPPAPTSLVTKDLVVGTGASASASSTVVVKYVGANYADGKVFDDSPWQQGSPATFPLDQVVPGFAQGIVGMKVGGRRQIVIPAALGYGSAGSPPAVGPNETLVFVVDLVKVQ